MTERTRQAGLVAYRALTDVAGKGAFFVVTVIAARRLSRDAFGLFSLGTTVGWIAAVATDFGSQLHLARAVAQRPRDAARLLHAWLRVRLFTSAIAVGTVAVGLAVSSQPAGFAPAILVFTLVYVVNGLIEFLHYFYRGLSRTDLESTLTLTQRGAMLALALAALWWKPDVTVLALAMAIPSIATFWYSARLARDLAGSIQSSPSTGLENSGFSVIGGSLGSVVPIGLGIVLSALYFRIDVFLVEAWQGTAAVALYNAVFRIVDAMRLFPAAVLAVALPVLCRATSRHVLVKLAAIVSGAALLASAALWAGAGVLVPLLYGSQYAEAVPAFRILLMAFPLMSVNYALTHQLIGWHGERAYAVMCAVALALNIGLNVRLIPEMGILGASWATVATELVITAGCLVALPRASRFAANRSNVSNPSSNLSNLSGAAVS